MTDASAAAPQLASGLAIDFALVGHGWMACSFAVEGEPAPCTVTASYLSDVIGDFLGLAMSIATGSTRAGAVVLQREPEGSVVTCLVRGDIATVSIVSSDDVGDMTFRVSVSRLVTAIADAADRIDRDAYREEWSQSDFPEGRSRATPRGHDDHGDAVIDHPGRATGRRNERARGRVQSPRRRRRPSRTAGYSSGVMLK